MSRGVSIPEEWVCPDGGTPRGVGVGILGWGGYHIGRVGIHPPRPGTWDTHLLLLTSGG